MKTFPAIAVLLALSTTALGAEPVLSEIATSRAKTLKANVKEFQLSLSPDADADKPYYRLLLSVPKINVKQADGFFLVAQLTEEQALKIIQHLAETGALDRAVEKGKGDKPPRPSYQLTVTAGELHLTEALGWDLAMLEKLDRLRKVLDGNAATEMDRLLPRMSGHRREWEAAEQKEIARLNQYYPHGYHFVDALRADREILWFTNEVIGGRAKSQRREFKSVEEFKQAFLAAAVKKEAAIDVHVRETKHKGLTQRAESILKFIQAEGYAHAGSVSN